MIERCHQKNDEGPFGPSFYDSPIGLVMIGVYFFFEDFLLLFFDEDLDDFFAAAIVLTTFHAVRDLSVAPTWQKEPDCSGQLESEVEGDPKGKE